MSIETLTLNRGEVAFLWFNNYSGVYLKTAGKTLVFDPADVDPRIFKSADILLITHEHFDHFEENLVKEIYRRTQCAVLADSTSARRLRDALPANKLHEMRIGKEIKLGNITVRAEAYKHPAATPVSYFITSEDGVKVYYTGDSLPCPDMKQVGERSPPDIVFCTVGPPAPGASPKTGLEIVKMVKPKMAIPYHAPAADRKKFVEIVSKETPNVKCLDIERDKPYKYP
jgi:L-ascorbate metabolism protein UlaG (beta-lactamase superfamily)